MVIGEDMKELLLDVAMGLFMFVAGYVLLVMLMTF